MMNRSVNASITSPDVQLSFDLDRQAFPAELIDDVQRAKDLSVVGTTMHEVIRPDVIAVFWSQPDA